MNLPMDHFRNLQTALRDKIMAALAPYGIKLLQSRAESFAKQLMECWKNESRDRRDLQAKQSGTASPTMDIIHFLKDARDNGRMDEALWCAFLASHFGRQSVDTNHLGEAESAGRFLCAFGQRPMWTWAFVSANRSAFAGQLHAREIELRTLRFGNHRKYCSKKPQDLAKVVTSFVQWVEDHGGNPSAAFTIPQGMTAQPGFGELYRRFAVYGFGRTGRFDLLNFLGQTELLNIEPDSCYLLGSTGPLAGAEQLCGMHADRELSKIIDNLANSLGISYGVMEDALCIWQKGLRKRSAGLRSDVLDSSFVPLKTIHRK